MHPSPVDKPRQLKDFANRYWQFIAYLFLGLLVLEFLLSPMRPIYDTYSQVIGYIGLSVEAFLPVPQILINMQSRSCKGFRLSLLGSWVIGDTMKIVWLFTAETEIPWAFKLCGMFQACCDFFLGFQYLMYGAETPTAVKEHPMSEIRSSHRGETNGRPSTGH